MPLIELKMAKKQPDTARQDGHIGGQILGFRINNPRPKGRDIPCHPVIPSMARDLKIPHFVRDDNKRRKRRGNLTQRDSTGIVPRHEALTSSLPENGINGVAHDSAKSLVCGPIGTAISDTCARRSPIDGDCRAGIIQHAIAKNGVSANTVSSSLSDLNPAP